MSTMVDFKPILEALRRIPHIQDDIIAHFEDTFRNNYASIDISLLLNGSVPQDKISTLLTSSLESTAQHCLDLFDQSKDQKYNDIANMLWNPLIVTLFKVITSKPAKIDEKSAVKVLPKTNVVKVAKPVHSPVSLSETQIVTVQQRLKDIQLQRTHLYQTPGHTHIKCDAPNCEFCTHLFNNLNITKCEGHKRCSISGWYPHVGPALWQMLRKKHSARAKPTIQPKLCKPHEIPALSVGNGDVKTNSPMEADLQSEASSNFSTPISSPKRSSHSWVDDLPDDLEEYYLTQKRVKTANTTSSKE